jgi:uncharacterized protein YecE (DUF72 family)
LTWIEFTHLLPRLPRISKELYLIKAEKLHIGTSGWHYDHWKGPFYPEDLTTERWLSFYSEHLDTVEINNSFYQLPETETLESWRLTTPEGFLFAVKASRYVTHMKKLKDPDQPLANFLGRMMGLGDKLGPILFQLPPNWHLNLERLNSFLDKLPEGRRFAFEFRDPSWFDERVYQLLSAHDAALCIYEFGGRKSPKESTTNWIYVRLHGPEGAYRGKYDVQTLTGWIGAFSTWMRQGKEIYCYFDNDEAGYAAQNAITLKGMAEDNDRT